MDKIRHCTHIIAVMYIIISGFEWLFSYRHQSSWFCTSIVGKTYTKQLTPWESLGIYYQGWRYWSHICNIQVVPWPQSATIHYDFDSRNLGTNLYIDNDAIDLSFEREYTGLLYLVTRSKDLNYLWYFIHIRTKIFHTLVFWYQAIF